MTILATPENSCLLIVDPLGSCCDQLTKMQSEFVRTQFSVLAKASSLVSVPRYIALSSRRYTQEEWLLHPCKKSLKCVFEFSIETTPWSNVDLIEAIKKEERERLFVCGFWLENTVSAAALDAYVDGFDVHLISDLALPGNVTQGKFAMERLLQIGIVPISVQQLIYEWMTKTQNSTARKNLRSLIDEDLQ